MKDLQIVQSRDGVLLTDSYIVAQGTDSQHRAVLQLIKNNIQDFEEFGGVAFEMQPFETAGGKQERTVAVLNREQAMLLMTYMRNNAVIKDFKKRLIKAFVELEKAVATHPALPQNYTEALRALLESEERKQAALEQSRQLTAELEAARPAVEYVETVREQPGLIDVQQMAQLLSNRGYPIGRTNLFRWLKDKGMLFQDFHGDYRIKQQYVNSKWFELRHYRPNYRDGVSTKVYITLKGQEGIFNKYVSEAEQ